MFKEANLQRLTQFNSDSSYKLLDIYNNSVTSRIQANRTHMSSRTFAPSSLRCKRRSWFRLRGVEPDSIDTVDAELQFAADIGTACHELIQSDLKTELREDWIDVSEYLANKSIAHSYTTSNHGLETFVMFQDPPVKFSVDGLIRLNNKYFLLEIKTVPFNVWDKLTAPKDEHVDQVKCYCTMLDLNDCIMLYQDRQYGHIKCYEISVPECDKIEVLNGMQYVLDCVHSNIAPEGLDSSDKWCSSNYCQYYRKCKEY